MARSPLSKLLSAIAFASLALAACGGSGGPAPDFRGDPLCAGATVTAQGSSCDLSVTMHGHTYGLDCDLSQGQCQCVRDGRRLPDGYAFGGSAAPACTLDQFQYEWMDCCGTPE